MRASTVMSSCWLCGAAESVEFLPGTLRGEVRSDDFKISDSHYGRNPRLVECRACGFRYADPLPARDLVGLYASLVDDEYSAGSKGRIKPFRRILHRALRLAPRARTLLDVGASTGLLCLAARELGLEATGVEPSQWAVAIASERHRVKVLQGTFPHPELEGQRFDLITLVDVIEHVSDPGGLLREVVAALAPGGMLVVTTPNARSLAARWMGQKWWHYRAAHVCFFDRRTMRNALRRTGLEIVRVESYGWFFPVGYVAERLERYLPVGRLRRALDRTRIGKALFGVTIPVNLRDSLTYYARESKGSEG